MNPEFLSSEASASPSVEPLLALAKALDARGIKRGALSARDGLRTTTHADVAFKQLAAADFIEVADYDSRLDRLLCMGRREPHVDAGMHHLMLRAKKEVNVLVHAGAARGADAPEVRPGGATQLARAMSALEALRGRDAIALDGRLLVAARTVDEAALRAFALAGAE